MTFPLRLDWRRGPDMPFAMYDSIQSVEVEGTVYVGGGLADKTNNMYIVMAYDTQSYKWNTLPPYSAAGFAMTTIHNKLVLVGGRHNGMDVDQLGMWQTDSYKWTCPFPPMPTPHRSPSATSYKHWLVVAGGSRFNRLNVEVLNVDNNQLSTGPSKPTPWQSMKSTTIGDTWYLMGGNDDWGSHTGGYYISLEALASHSATDGSNLWRKLPSLDYSYSCPLNIEGSLLAFGGLNRKKCGVSTIQRYVPETNTWVAAGELPLGVYDCTCIITSGKLYMIGGHDTKTSLKSIYTTDVQL